TLDDARFLRHPLSKMLATPVGATTMLRSSTSISRGRRSATALLGVASGGFFAVSAVGYRAATLALAPGRPALAAAGTLVFAQFVQSVILGGYLMLRAPQVVAAVCRAWRISLVAGFMGA